MTRDERLEFRLFAEEKAVLERAAALVGADTPGAWVRTLALRDARKVLRDSLEDELAQAQFEKKLWQAKSETLLESIAVVQADKERLMATIDRLRLTAYAPRRSQ